MQNNYSQKIFMQIPQENTYTGLALKPDLNEEFNKLSNNYKVHRIHQVKEFIKNNPELMNYINKITPIINKFFPKHIKCITFCRDYEFEELNDITIYINSSNESFDDDCEKFDELEVEIIKLNGFTTNIKKLVSMDLWLI